MTRDLLESNQYVETPISIIGVQYDALLKETIIMARKNQNLIIAVWRGYPQQASLMKGMCERRACARAQYLLHR
jgi:hypothetical protein